MEAGEDLIAGGAFFYREEARAQRNAKGKEPCETLRPLAPWRLCGKK